LKKISVEFFIKDYWPCAKVDEWDKYYSNFH